MEIFWMRLFLSGLPGKWAVRPDSRSAIQGFGTRHPSNASPRARILDVRRSDASTSRRVPTMSRFNDTSGPVSGKQGEAGPLIELADLRRACEFVRGFAHADTRHNLDATLDNLIAAYANHGISSLKVPLLRGAIRKHLSAAWTDGVVVPIAKSREEADRALMKAMPQVLVLADHAGMVSTLNNAARWVPERSAGTRTHVARALAFLGCVPIIHRASEHLDSIAFTVTREAQRAADAPFASRQAHRRAQAEQARKALRGVLSNGLRSLSEAASAAPYGHVFSAISNAAFRGTAPILEARPPLDGPRFGRSLPVWRKTLRDALSEDLVEGLVMPALGCLMERHDGLIVRGARYAREGDLAGTVSLDVERGSGRLVLSGSFDLAVGRLERVMHGLAFDGEAVRLDEAGVDALLDAAAPPEFDTAAHRVLRTATPLEARRGISMAVSPDGELLVRGLVGRHDAEPILRELVDHADGEGVAISLAPSDDVSLMAAMTELGFTWRKGRNQPLMVRDAPEAFLRLSAF